MSSDGWYPLASSATCTSIGEPGRLLACVSSRACALSHSQTLAHLITTKQCGKRNCRSGPSLATPLHSRCSTTLRVTCVSFGPQNVCTCAGLPARSHQCTSAQWSLLQVATARFPPLPVLSALFSSPFRPFQWSLLHVVTASFPPLPRAWPAALARAPV